MVIKPPNVCGLCHNQVHSVEHTLLECKVSREVWDSMNNWIIERGMENYHLSNEKIIVGDLENALAIKSIILITKKVIYNAIKKEQQLGILNVKNDIKNSYFQEKYRHYIRGRGKQFDKKYL